MVGCLFPQTDGSGNAKSDNHLWLSLGGSESVADTYIGTIYYRIAQ